MEGIATIERYKYDVYKWRCEADILTKLALALGKACLTGLLAQIRVVLPWSPVPVTGQTLGVLLAGVFLGRCWGGISMALYAGAGSLGVPWFSGWSGGFGALFGPTGGYILGFILAGLFLGYFTDKYIRARSFLTMFGLMLIANFVLIHGPGLLNLGIWLAIVKGKSFYLWQLLWMGTIPFIAGDITKAAIAAAMARGITPKRAYNGEVDRGKEFWRVP